MPSSFAKVTTSCACTPSKAKLTSPLRDLPEGALDWLIVRENSEGVALIRGEADEERGLKRAFGRVTGVMHELNRAERNLVGLSSAYAMITMVFPILVASPRYFAGAISLGVLMQVGSAFGEVTRALNWFMDNYPRLADWVSHVDRVVELEDSLDATGCIDQRCALDVEEGAGGADEAVSLQGVAVATPDGKPLVRAYSMVSPAWEEHLEFLSIKVQHGPLTSRLQHIRPGDEIILRPKPVGTLVVDAAKKVGIDIPVFCYHPKMEPVGMCRQCLVEIGRPVIDRATGQVVVTFVVNDGVTAVELR